jgi:serine/threonine protein kinase
MPQADAHQNLPLLEAYGLGKVSSAAAETIAQHLDTCAECRHVVAELPADGFLSRLQNLAAHPATVSRNKPGPGGNRPLTDDARIRDSRDTETLPPPASGPRESASKTGVVAAPHVATAPHVVISSSEPLPPALATNPDYDVVREINRGGMGVVYLVRNRRMDRLEGLKVVKEALLNRSGALERFEREMRAAARLSHPNIVLAYSSPRLEGLLAFAMEYVDGVDLHELVKSNGPLPVSNACYYANQAAKGLQHAFEQSMVHRDIKPNNLILTRDGKKQVIKILDFGLAKATSEHPLDAGLTGTGQILGTPQYMAPEQIQNAAKADIRADIYSLGCTLYFLLTGHAPFKGKGSVYDILQAQQLEEAQPLDEVRPEVPAELAAIVAKMIAKNPAARYQQPAEVSEALAPYFKHGVKSISRGTPAIPPLAPRRAAPPPEVAPETATSKEANTNIGQPSPPAPARSNPSGAAEDAKTPLQTMLELVVDRYEPPNPLRSRTLQSRARLKQRRTMQVWLLVAGGILAMALLGLWVGGGVFDPEEKPAESADASVVSQESEELSTPTAIIHPVPAAATPSAKNERSSGPSNVIRKAPQVTDSPKDASGMPASVQSEGQRGRVAVTLEGEELEVLLVSTGRTSVQNMAGYVKDTWSGAKQLYWTGGKPGGRLELKFQVAEAGSFDFLAVFTMARDYGIINVEIDGKTIRKEIDLYNFPDVITTGELNLGKQRLDAGPHKLTLVIAGANPAAVQAFMVGLDYVRLQPSREK